MKSDERFSEGPSSSIQNVQSISLRWLTKLQKWIRAHSKNLKTFFGKARG